MTQKKQLLYARSGFTMMELLVAIVIIGILFTGGVVSYNMYRERAAKTATQEIISADTIALRAYYEDVGRYPAKLRDLLKSPAGTEESQNWAGPYVKSDKALKDGWKKKLIYKPSGDRQSFELMSHNKQIRATSE